MKNLITIFIMLIAVGCMSPAEKLRNSVVGDYVLVVEGVFAKIVFLQNGKAELYENGKKTFEGTWEMVGKEVHSKFKEMGVWRIESNGDLTPIAKIKNSKRVEAPKELQLRWKKYNYVEPEGKNFN